MTSMARRSRPAHVTDSIAGYRRTPSRGSSSTRQVLVEEQEPIEERHAPKEDLVDMFDAESLEIVSWKSMSA